MMGTGGDNPNSMDFDLLRHILARQTLDNMIERRIAIDMVDRCAQFMHAMNAHEPGIVALEFKLTRLLQRPELVVAMQTTEDEWIWHEEAEGEDEALVADFLVDMNSLMGVRGPQSRQTLLDLVFSRHEDDRDVSHTRYTFAQKDLQLAPGKLLGKAGRAMWTAEMQRRGLEQETPGIAAGARRGPTRL